MVAVVLGSCGETREMDIIFADYSLPPTIYMIMAITPSNAMRPMEPMNPSWKAHFIGYTLFSGGLEEN